MAKQLFKAVYRQPKTFETYKDGKINLYPDETVIENYTPEKMEGQDSEPEPYTGYQYEGEERDGGYIRDCADPTDLHDVANAIVRTHYSLSEELALQRKHAMDAETYKEEWDAYCEFASRAAKTARQWLGITE